MTLNKNTIDYNFISNSFKFKKEGLFDCGKYDESIHLGKFVFYFTIYNPQIYIQSKSVYKQIYNDYLLVIEVVE